MRLITLLFVLLASCATPDTRHSQMRALSDEVNALREAKAITYVEAQKRKYARYRELWPDDPYAAEFFSYTIMLGEKVDAGELTDAEYQYLANQKRGEIAERVSNDQARRAHAAAAIWGAMPKQQPVQVQSYQPRQINTTCRTDSFGNTRCVSQ